MDINRASLMLATLSRGIWGSQDLTDINHRSAGPGGAVDREFGLHSGGFGPQDRSQRRENGRGKPVDRFSGPGDHSGPISGHFRRFRPNRQMSAAKTGQVPAAETGQVSVVETRQMLKSQIRGHACKQQWGLSNPGGSFSPKKSACGKLPSSNRACQVPAKVRAKSKARPSPNPG